MRHALRAGIVMAMMGLAGCAASTPSAPADPPAASPAASLGKPLDAGAVAALYGAPHREDGVVLSGAHQGAHWTKWIRPDGSLELSAAHGLFADSGRFVLRGNVVCARWEQIDHGRENCMHLVQDGPDEYTSIGADGQPGSRFKVEPPEEK